MVSRRDLLKMGLISAGGLVAMPPGGGYGRVSGAFDNQQSSPRLTPFVDSLPTLNELRECDRFAEIAEYARPFAPVGGTTKFYEISAEERFVKFHRDLPDTAVWAYVDPSATAIPGPPRLLTFRLPPIRVGQGANAGILVRHYNNLTTAPRDFGFPTLTPHFHGAHVPAAADGFPHNILNRPDGFPTPVTIASGKFFDYMYPLRSPGFRDGPETTDETPSVLWFHDHILDFTGPNVYRGLANVVPVFDADVDTNDETEDVHHPGALRLPSGACDIPIVLQDKIFDNSGSLIFDPFNQDGFLGDTMLVNGVVQPRHQVTRRKYRLRFLNGSNARIYEIFLTNDLGQTFPMTQIATEGGLLAASIPNVRSFTLPMARRVEVVVDFGHPIFNGQGAIYIENRMAQIDGRKPDGVVDRGTKLLKLELIGDRVADDPSRLPAVLRPFAKASRQDIDAAERHTFKFDRSHGVFTINGTPVDIENPVVSVKRNRPQIWRFENSSGGWWHPIHVHSEFMRCLQRNGQPPPLNEADGNARLDTVLLRGGENVEMFVKFRDYSGPFVFHCHNIEHEDMAMMARYDVID